jgi:hypothetical protein
VEDRARRRRERHRRRDHLVARGHVERAQGEDQTRGARVGPDDVRRGRALSSPDEEAAELLLERRDLRSERQEEGVEHPSPGPGFLFAELVPVKLDLVRHGALVRPSGGCGVSYYDDTP